MYFGGAVAVNDRGQVIGARYLGGATRGFLWQKGKMVDLGTLGGEDSGVIAILESGQVIGWSDTKSGARHAFLWQHGKMTDLGTLGGAESEAHAINDRGQIVGESNTAGGAVHATLWHRGRTIDLGTLGGKTSRALAINERGLIVGYSRRPPKGHYAFIWQRGTMTALGRRRSSAFALNERGEVVGWSRISSSERTHAVLWRMGRMVDLGRASGPSGERVDSEGWAINERTQVIVGSTGAGGQEFLWQDGVRIGLGIDVSRGETKMNDRGQVVGSFVRGGAAVWEDGRVTRLPKLPGSSDSSAVALNDRGQIVGWARTEGKERHAVLWTPR